MKQQILKEEIQYLLENDFIEPSKSEWSSPCILVPKPDGSFRMCTDYRKVNNCTKTDTFPLPRIDDCIDKFDLLKGFWQIPLTEKAKEISAFVTPDGLLQYKVMPFGMKNLYFVNKQFFQLGSIGTSMFADFSFFFFFCGGGGV